MAVAGLAPQLQFTAASGVTSLGQLGISSVGGHTQIGLQSSVILPFGVTSVSAGDFIFG